MPTIDLAEPVSTKPALVAKPVIEVWFRRVVITFAAVAALGVLSQFVVSCWAQNEFTQAESVLAAQVIMFAQHGTLYYGLKTYPYTVTAYMPIFYLLDGALVRAGLPAYLAARLISFSAYLVILFLCWRITLIFTNQRYCAGIAVILVSSTSLPLVWGTTGQVDTLAVMFALAGFERFSLFWVRQERTYGPNLVAAAAFALAALFTKQTALACPAAIFCALYFRRKKLALQFGAGFLGAAFGLILLLDTALHGRFLLNIVWVNMFPMRLDKLQEHVHYMLITCVSLILTVVLGLRTSWRKPAGGALLYMGFACAVWLATAAKLGSDSNYQIETTVLLAICTVLTLHGLDFFPHIFSGSRAWVTLLQIPLALHPFMNFRITPPTVIGRVVQEKLFRRQIAELRPYLSGPERGVSAEINAFVRTRRPLEVEPLVYTMMVNARQVDPEPFRKDLARGVPQIIVLFSEAGHPYEDPEIPSLPAVHLAEIRQHYDLVAQVPGPYLRGAYVYRAKPKQPGEPQ